MTLRSERDAPMYHEPSPSPQSDPLTFLSRQLNSVARRWHASGLKIHRLHGVDDGIGEPELVFEWFDRTKVNGWMFGPLDVQVLDVQWRRLSLRKDVMFEGPSLALSQGHVVLSYVGRPDAGTSLSIVLAVPSLEADAAGCSTEIDRLLLATVPPPEFEYMVLSRRELEVARWISEGKTSYEAALILGISEHTVNEYIRSGMRKMGATNRLSFVAKTIRMGLVA
ncbi:helix-turn-helix transcriptional regulator [Peteryoungia desertarenae]|uniref:Helix-turn-helix transcriptional regulator n=1 Tax=Peteryoungia desertarenae TaxID=1813451 RepID=A0ABX6QIX5_9HYPH|nr:helix-turn-helix transcriptional regulator [Peteryoungia desertarenae]QLF68518.1 helix-turn-helix transcriptional regulator [Peteryoungia desertarenae]